MLSYSVDGDDGHPAVLFLHGFMGSQANWTCVTKELQRSYRCVRVDLPGHGGSIGLPPDAYTMAGTAKALRAVLDALGADRCALVGYSMGGRIALYFALHHSDRCRRLVLESASPGLRTEAERETRRDIDEARALRLEAGDLEAFLDAWYRQPLFESLAARADLLEQTMQERRRNDPRELARALRGLGTGRQPSLWEHLETLAVPTLAVAGALDGTYAELVERMGILNPKIRTAIIPNAGHNVHVEYPDVFRDLLKDFLKQP